MTTPRLRLEDPPLLTGAGRYVADLIDPDTLHCIFVRSPLAHGVLTSPDLSAARSMPGVVGVFAADDLDLPDLPSSPGRGAPEAIGMGQPPLARDRVRYQGEPVAVVVAETALQAVDAADQVWLDIEPLPAVMTFEQAVSDQTLLFPEAGTNLVADTVVGVEGPPPAVEVEATVEVEIPRVSPVTIEPLAILVRPQGDKLEVFCGHQSPGRLPAQLGSLVGVEPARIRARVPDVGGAFGTKGQFYPEYVVVTALAHRLGQPVAWIERRREQLMGGTHGRGQTVKVTIGGDQGGRIRAVQLEFRGEIGAYPSTGSRIPFFSLAVAQGLYDIEYLQARVRVAVTNRA
ncbi:MAG TPA: molybdopterin cofactor-binding domain-containing protein, partial [Acidimicrobiia bacterium]|nr:molybdopterin cofactor-binding domain-containing protein [Acidimicrobiia bacterium]